MYIYIYIRIYNIKSLTTNKLPPAIRKRTHLKNGILESRHLKKNSGKEKSEKRTTLKRTKLQWTILETKKTGKGISEKGQCWKD